ncbi:hypothetical protein EG68_04167 [Paragonimus skrjabini miyazakii]|uniref:EF-hand domain-containing protein n=1 Tax=Paragonimus skrjabini miyazakii TaxID=59628 RepID=A0A8S9Z5U5_9TREM|nr:hypothetical protein EG68_04167 [Paragonimus skrjabini miyazakii]
MGRFSTNKISSYIESSSNSSTVVKRSRKPTQGSYVTGLWNRDHEIEEIFYLIDKNKNGKISRRELQSFFKKNDCKYKSKEVKEYIKRIDQDGDGSISLMELKQALRRA